MKKNHLNVFRTLLMVLMVLLCQHNIVFSQNMKEIKMPDFDYPEDVVRQADKNLAAAMKDNDQKAIVLALVQKGLARTSVTERSAAEVIQTIDSVMDKGRLTPDYKALLWYLEAEIWRTLDERYDYDGEARNKAELASQRSLDPLGNGDVSSLVRPLKDYESLIVMGNDLGNRSLPTLHDFLMCHRLSHLASSVGKTEGTDSLEAHWLSLHEADADVMPRLFIEARDYLDVITGSFRSRRIYDREKVESLYRKYSDHEESALLLGIFGNDDKYYDDVCGYLSRFPKSEFASRIENIRTSIEAMEVRLEYEHVLQTTDSIVVTASMRNVNECMLTLYQVPDDLMDEKQYNVDVSKLTRLESIDISTEGKVPFRAENVKGLFAPRGFGHYVVLASYMTPKGLNKPEKIHDYELQSAVLSVSDLRMFAVNKNLFAVDSHTGRPRQGAEITRLENNGKVTQRLTTNSDGFVTADDGRYHNNAQWRATDGADRCLPSSPFYLTHYQYGTSRQEVDVFTDLEIYRPGETVRVNLVAKWLGIDSRRALPDVNLTVSLFDAAGNGVAEKEVVTDDFGQAVCEFPLPTDRMNGVFSIKVEGMHDGSSIDGYDGFVVSEYKTPAFYVDLSKTQSTQPKGGKAVIRGQVMTYSGVPVAGCEVKCTIDPRTWWMWYSGGGLKSHEFVATTDSEGSFEYVCPEEWTPSESGPTLWRTFRTYHVTATCTNAAGETHQGETSFWMGSCRSITLSDATCRIVPGRPVQVNVAFRSTDPDESSVGCSYTLVDENGKTVASGSFNTDAAVFDWNVVPSGRYRMKALIDGDTDDNAVEAEIILYRESDKLPPVKSALWVPKESQSVTDDLKARILIGTTTGSWIYYTASSRNSVVATGWVHYQPGMHWLELPMPKERDEKLSMTLITVNDGKPESLMRSFSSPNKDKLKITAVSFRNRIEPGNHEHWKFALTDADGKPVQGRMMFELYNKALDDLFSNNWHLRNGYIDRQLFYNHLPSYAEARSILGFSGDNRDSRHVSLMMPEVQMYGRRFFDFYNHSRRFLAGSMVMKAAAPEAIMSLEDDDSFVVGYSTNNTVYKESAVVDLADTGNGVYEEEEADAGPQSSLKGKFDKIELRTGEVKVALWQPMLTADADGNISIEFDAPNFNTTWRAQALAYNNTLAYDVLSENVLSQRPVMVQPSLPRFLRAGDVTTLAASVLNATDKDNAFSGVIELFDPRTQDVIKSEPFSFELPAKGTHVVKIGCKAPVDAPYIGFRIMGYDTDGNGDGEQQMLPVLTNVSPIIETEPFYQNPGEDELTVRVPESSESATGSRLTFEFCNNPAWYCVTALPAIADADAVTSTGLANGLFAIAVAARFAENNPSVLEAIDECKQMEREQSPLTSQLARNSDLKIGSLLASPWLPEAERQELRMMALDKLFQSTRNDEETGRIIEALARVHRPDGGFAWIDDSKWADSDHVSSYWATEEVLQLVGEMWRLGCLTDEPRLQEMISEAVHYFDRETLRHEDEMLKHFKKSLLDRMFSKDKRPSYIGFRGYAYVRTLFDNIECEPSIRKRISQLNDRVIQDLSKEWSSISMPDRAFAAMTLFRNDKPVAAKSIIESLRQFAVKDASRGMYWERIDRGMWFLPVACTATMLQAFAEVDPRQAEIDQIRKWMLLEKQTSDWGGSSMAADAVYAILTIGTDWLHAHEESTPLPKVWADGKELELPATDSRLGYVRISLPEGTKQVKLNRAGDNPAWGALYHQYVAPMSEIAEQHVDEVRIDKKITIDGNRAKVTLVVTCDKALEYVVIHDERPAFLEPADQMSGYRWESGFYYQETKDSETRFFFNRLNEGRHVINYDCFVTNHGEFTSGIATVQSQYAPQFTAHSAGSTIRIEE